MSAASHQASLVVALSMLALASIGVLSQSRRIQEKRNSIVVVLSWGTLLLSILMIVSNDAFSQFIINELIKMRGL